MPVPSSRAALAGAGSLLVVLACVLVATTAGRAAAATKVDDSYEVKLVSGTGATDELRVKVPDDQADPDAAWRVEVTGEDGGGCDAFGLALLDGNGSPGQAVDGARVVDGRLQVTVQLTAADAGGPLEPGDYSCGLHLATGDFGKDVKVDLEVSRAQQVAPATRAPVPPPTTRAAPATTKAAATTTSTGAPTTTGEPTTTAAGALAPVAAPGAGGSGGGGGPALGGRGPLIGAVLALALAMLLLGGGMLATSQRSPRRIAPPGEAPEAGPQEPPPGAPGAPGGFRPAGR